MRTGHCPLKVACVLVVTLACAPAAPTALRAADPGAGPTVEFDLFNKPFANIPLPNNFATRFDATSPTLRRLNASIAAGTTDWERATRDELDTLTGWGPLAPITVSFSEPLDVEVIYQRHHHDIPDFKNDAVLVINVTPDSPGYCEAVPLDLGQGNFPVTLPNPHLFPSDPRGTLQQLQFEEVEEDLNHNGLLDPGEDTDMDGVLDHPNTRNGLAGGEVMDFYERETNTLIMKPIVPMREQTTYAVVLTRRLTSPSGLPVRSPFDGINHTSQTQELAGLGDCLSRHYAMTLADVAFTWSFSTMSITDDYKSVRDGLYGLGPLAHLSTAFPATVSALYDVQGAAPGITNTKILKGASMLPLVQYYVGGNKAQGQYYADCLKFVDYVVVGEVQSPQLFPRDDANGKRLPLWAQTWDLSKPPRTEAVPFLLWVPKARQGGAPVSIFIHGHGSNNGESLSFAPVLARYGVATLAINAPSHGLAFGPIDLQFAQGLFDGWGIRKLGDALFASSRALDWDGSGTPQSGADYWTAYIFHTRDMVRQTMVDVMQVVRMLRGFDGTRTWSFDLNGSGHPGVAGDFDGDGTVDVGGPGVAINVVGGSLGGITGAMAAGVEPQLTSVVSIVPGGDLNEIGVRSALGGVQNGMVLRMMEPIFHGDYSDGGTLMEYVNRAEVFTVDLAVHAIPVFHPQDTVVLTNSRNGEYRCGAVQADGNFRVTVPTDQGDPLVFSAYAGPLPSHVRTGCVVPQGAAPLITVSTFDRAAPYGGTTFAKDSPLTAATDGYGLRRGTPDLRRLMNLAQVGIEQGDPMNFAPFWEQNRVLTYGTGETVATNVLMMPSLGDPGVPIATGIALARGAGFVPYDQVDPRYGKSANQELIDTFTIEGVSRLAHFTDASGTGVLMDVEHLSAISGANDGFDVPRLSPPLHLPRRNASGAFTGVLLPMFNPHGEHGFAFPDPSAPFDQGSLLGNMIGHWLATEGQEFSYDACQVNNSCSWFPLPPP